MRMKYGMFYLSLCIVVLFSGSFFAQSAEEIADMGIQSQSFNQEAEAIADAVQSQKPSVAASLTSYTDFDPQAPPQVIPPSDATRDFGNLLLHFSDLPTITGDQSHLGVAYANGYFWVTTSQAGAPPNYLCQIDEAGNLVQKFSQPTTGWGWRDLAWDGTFLYGSVTNAIEQIDPATGQPTGVQIPGPETPNRALAYDPATDHFWTVNFASPLYELDRSGTIINQFTNPMSSYGAAWDVYLDTSKPYIWLNTGTATGDTHVMRQCDPITGQLTGLSITGITGLIAGGLDMTTEMAMFPGLAVMVAIGQSTSLTVWEIAPAGDPSDPNPPDNFTAYSDYATPTTMLLNWTDPTEYVDGTPLTNFQIIIARDAVVIDSVGMGTETYTDTGPLNDGQSYAYDIWAKDIPNDSTSSPASVTWTAGGAGEPDPPAAFSLTSAGGGDLMAHWTNPSTNVDGTPMDDFDAINIYEDGTFLTTFTRSPADTGSADSATFTPGGVNLPYYVTAVDNESPANESVPSGTAYPPYAAPYFEDFEGGVLPPLWTNETDDDFDWTINSGGTTSSGTGPTGDHTTGSGFYMYTETSSPVASGDVAHLTTPFIDLSTVSQPGMAFWYHMHGAAMGELHVDVYANGMWNLDVMPPLIGQQQPNQTDPYLQAVVDLSNYAASPVQVRFRGICGTSFTSDMAIDDVFFGSLAANPQMTVAPLTISDTLLVGGTSMFPVLVSNIAAVPASLNYTVSENPSVTWLNVLPTSGTVTSGQKDTLNVTLDATGLSAGMYNTELIVAGNDTTNFEDTVAVTLEVNDAPVIHINPDTFDVVVASGNVEMDTLTIRNDGVGPLYFTAGPGQPLDRSLINGKPRVAKVDRTTLSPEFLAAMDRRSSQTGVVNALDELQSNASSSGLTMPDQIMGEEIFGSTANPFSGPDRDRGNIFSVTNATTLIEHRLYLDITASTELVLFVYEGSAVTGTYNKIDEVFYANSGSGPAFYTSGPINVPLEVGKYYYIGASWLGDAEYYRSSDPTPLPTSFGMLETGIPGNIAGGYPPTATANNTYASGGFSPYYCAIVTGVGIDWLSANPDSGMVAPGDSLDVEVTFDPTGLLGGDYYADIVVNSNDPVNPEVRAGAHMFVQAEANISFNPPQLAFDTTYVNGTSTMSGHIVNDGAGVLDVTNIQSTNAVFSVDTASFQVPALDSFEVNVSFSPTTAGTPTGWLLISSNDPDTPVDSVWMQGVAVLPTGIANLTALPTSFDVAPNYPNPFNPTTTINYQLPRTSDVKLVIYNVLGQKVRTLVNARMEAGYHSIEWDGNNQVGAQAASGIYIYRFQAEDYLKIQKMILMK